MTYQEFINSIFSAFQNFTSHILSFVTILFENHFIKTIVFIIIIYFIIYVIYTLFSYVYEILNGKHDKKEIVNMISSKNNETSKEKSKNKNGDNIKEKDLYW